MKITSRFARTSAIDSQSNCLNATDVFESWSMRAIIMMPVPVSTITQHMIAWLAYGWKRSGNPQEVRNNAPTKASIHK